MLISLTTTSSEDLVDITAISQFLISLIQCHVLSIQAMSHLLTDTTWLTMPLAGHGD